MGSIAEEHEHAFTGDQEANGTCPGCGLILIHWEQLAYRFEIMNKMFSEANSGHVPKDALIMDRRAFLHRVLHTVIECVLYLQR